MKPDSWHISVVVPARNEEELLPRCLESLLRAKAAVDTPDSVDIVVVSDSSTDNTTALARELLGDEGLVIACTAGAVGPSRRLGVKRALRRRRAPLSHCWIANTDADCIAPANWLADQVALARRGIQTVAGTIAVDHFDEHGPEVPKRFRETYLIEADGTHPHVHACNIGMQAEAYLKAGEWPELASGEDHALWRQLLRCGVKPLSTSRIGIITSGRRTGRAPHGFAHALRACNEDAA